MRRVFRADVRTPDAQADLYLVGLGIGGWNRRTVEADEVLRTCDSVLHLTAFDDELRKLSNGRVSDLRKIYERETDASTAYALMTEAILSAAKSSSGPTAFVSYGHPLFLVDTAWDLRDRCADLPIITKTIPGTSYLDLVMSDLGVRFDYGFQVYESNYLVDRNVQVNPRQPLIIAQVGDFGTRSLRPRGDTRARLKPLCDALLRQLPGDAEAYLILSSWRDDMAPSIQRSAVRNLPTLLAQAHVGHTLVAVPGLPND